MIGVKFLGSMFDAKAILAAVDKAERTVLKIFGFNVRKEAMGSIKETPEGVAAPAGGPPHAHVRATKKAAKKGGKKYGGPPGGLRFIQYFVEGSRSVIIGPASNRTRSITIPEILEEGKLRVPQHPFMGPAFQRTLPRLPAMWAGSVKR